MDILISKRSPPYSSRSPSSSSPMSDCSIKMDIDCENMSSSSSSSSSPSSSLSMDGNKFSENLNNNCVKSEPKMATQKIGLNFSVERILSKSATDKNNSGDSINRDHDQKLFLHHTHTNPYQCSYYPIPCPSESLKSRFLLPPPSQSGTISHQTASFYQNYGDLPTVVHKSIYRPVPLRSGNFFKILFLVLFIIKLSFIIGN